MNPRHFLLPACCFFLAYGMTARFQKIHRPMPPEAARPSSAPRSGDSPVPRGAAKLPGGRLSLEEEIAALPVPAPDDGNDEALARRCAELLPTSPWAAFRLGMARWGFDPDAQRAAGMALVRADPAARRLLSKCVDLRSRNMLESCLMASETAAHPREKLRWAEANLDGHVRHAAVMAGAAALAAEDPDALLDFALEPAPSELTLSVMKLALEEKIKRDPAAAALWIHRNIPEVRKESISLEIFGKYAVTSPDMAKALLPELAPELREPMVQALMEQITGDPDDTGEPYTRSVEMIQGLPEDLRIPAFRKLIARSSPQDNAQGFPALLSAGTGPGEREAVLESLLIQAAEDSGPGAAVFLGQLQTPRDKAAASRVVPYLTGLTDEGRTALLDRLK
ncbi:MAG: hypothetical protein V4726_18445 [Verrucomicrobiota bacterium]